MAATLGAAWPATSSVFATRHANLGPFKSSGGNYYTFMRGATGSASAVPFKTSDPIATGFSSTGTLAKLMSSSTSVAIEAMACYPVGNVIHIVTQISTGACYYNSYTMDTDAWTLSTSETAVAAASQPPVTGATFVDLVVRSNGEVVIIHCAGQTAMSSGLNMVRYRRRTGTNTYQTAVNVDNGGSVNWAGGFAALGASDRVHFFLAAIGSGLLYQRTLTAANALETFPASYASGDTSTTVEHSNAISFVDAGTTRVRAGYARTSDALGSVAKLDSADAPTVSVDGGVTSGIPRNTGTQIAHFLANDGTTVHYLYASATDSDLYHDFSTSGGGAWGTDVNELTATINHITANVYDRSGNKLAAVIDDGGTLKYVEITLAAAVAASLIWPTETPYRILSRR